MFAAGDLFEIVIPGTHYACDVSSADRDVAMIVSRHCRAGAEPSRHASSCAGRCDVVTMLRPANSRFVTVFRFAVKWEARACVVEDMLSLGVLRPIS